MVNEHGQWQIRRPQDPANVSYCLAIPIVINKRLRTNPDTISLCNEVEDVVTGELPIESIISEL